MAPAQGVSMEGAAPAGAWSIFKPLSWPQGKKKFKVAHEGEKMQMYYDPVSKKWVEKGKEGEAAQDPGNAPPPTLLLSSGPGPVLPTGAARNSNRARRPITERYARQSNLGVSSSLDNLGRTASAPLPPCSFISPPASTSSSFFIPGPSPTTHSLINHDSKQEDAAHFGSETTTMAPEPASHTNSSPPSTLLGYPGSSTYSPPPAVHPTQVTPPATPSPGDSLHHPEATTCSTGASDSSSSSSAALAAMSDTETLLGIPAISSSEGSPCNSVGQLLAPPGPENTTRAASHPAITRTLSSPGSKTLHNGHKFALPRAFTNWASFQSALVDASSDSGPRRDQDFDAAMHPGNAGKLDGPLPWELPGQLRYSQDFLSICTAWQRRNPGKLYNPQQLLPHGVLAPVDEAKENNTCYLEIVSYLQHMVHSLKSNKEVPDEELKHAISLLSSLMACQECVEVRGGPPSSAEATPTKAGPAAALAEDAQKLRTPERLPSASPFLHSSSSPDLQSPFAKQVSARFVKALVPAALPVAAEQQPTLSEQCLELQLATMRQEVQEDYEQRLAARTSELEGQFESKVAAMRQELQEEYERRLQEKEGELQSQRQCCAELQNELDHLLLCLGQESRKVTDLSQAMKDAGLDADAITLSIEEEYSLIDLASSY